jgi:hypothetical protein
MGKLYNRVASRMRHATRRSCLCKNRRTKAVVGYTNLLRVQRATMEVPNARCFDEIYWMRQSSFARATRNYRCAECSAVTIKCYCSSNVVLRVQRVTTCVLNVVLLRLSVTVQVMWFCACNARLRMC